ncbi:MAG TPA: arginine--tRNA ligase [Solirubrobacteraceae bacterium]|jgi:arginyl-tRNA synthetase|nr:arginine--tRNA ligase [Solirubrobacteraceae bacterium]
MTTNLFDYFEEAREDGDPSSPGAPASPWAARAPRIPNERFDVKLVPRRADWQRDPLTRESLERIEAEPWADSLRLGEEDVELRLADAWIESTGAALEAGGGDEVELADLARGGRYAIQFWDANATKALHVGHLRNLALGNALAAALEQAGGEVERRSVISDAGRSMGEAMAGIVQSGHHTSAWPEGDQKSDHFVGLCYADYVASGGNSIEQIDEREDSLTRELRMRNDAADELLKRVLAGESEALELWFKTRAWVISGQRKTLSRLGVAFDRVFFESDFLEDGAELVQRGLREGVLERREDGVVLYATGVQELAEMPLVRADGQTTQHMRAVSYWMGSPDLAGVTTIQITGTEWVAHSTCIRQLMSTMTPSENGGASRGVHPTLDVFHGMVAQQKRAVSSSDEGGLLIDDLIEWIEQRIDADPALLEIARAHPAPERIPAQIALGYFLPYPMTPRVDFETDKLLTERESLGWDLVRARARRGELGGWDAKSGHRPAEDPDYRSAVVQSEIYRRHLRLAVERYDVTPVALYLRHLARWYLEAPRSGHVERVIHTLLDRSARGLGLEAGR